MGDADSDPRYYKNSGSELLAKKTVFYKNHLTCFL